MISTHPYNSWPLHVKLFTDDAVNAWKDATKDIRSFPLPLAFTCSTELEGVDGKSGKLGSGRQGPISVNDGDTIYAASLGLVTQFIPRTIHFHLSGQEYISHCV
jgi:hypothetical protein